MQSTVALIRSLSIFEDLTEHESNELANICTEYQFDSGAVIAYQRDSADSFYIVAAGRLNAFTVDISGVITKSVGYKAGDYFHDYWLLAEGVHDAIIRAAEPGRMVVIKQQHFVQFLSRHPAAILDMSEKAWQEVDRSAISPARSIYKRMVLLPGEKVEFESRRTHWVLLWALLSSILLVFVMAPLVFWGLGNLDPNNRYSILKWVAALLVAAPGFLYGFYKYLDWENDYLVITNMHLVHKEFDLGTFQSQILKIPLDQVQTVKGLKPGLIETMLKVGTVQVTTGAQKSKLDFDFIANPNDVSDTIQRIKHQKKALESGRIRAGVRHAIADHFGIPAQYTQIKDDNPSSRSGNAQSKNKAARKKRIRRRGNRVESNGTITYGRHWIVLLRKTWWTIAMFLSVIFTSIQIWLNMPAMHNILTVVLIALILVIVFGFFYVHYEDFSNDIFQVTDKFVIDIDRTSLGFAESRKTASLADVQNVSANKPNIFATIFGYGDVTIDTAGVSAEIVFEDVANPIRVQADIFERRDRMRQQRRQQEAIAQRRQITLMLDEYQQLREQDKIPRRTPDIDAFVIDPEPEDDAPLEI